MYSRSDLEQAENKKETHYRMIVSLLQINDDLCHTMRNRIFFAFRFGDQKVIFGD